MMVILLEAAIRSLALAIVTGFVLWALRIQNVRVQRNAWSVVLIAAIAMPLLMRVPGVPAKFTWTPTASRFWSPPAAAAPAAPLSRGHLRKPVVFTSASPSAARSLSPGLPPGGSARQTTAAMPSLSLAQVIAAAYLLVAGMLLLRLLFGLGSALRLWSLAKPVPALSAPHRVVRCSSAVLSPVTIGFGVLLPRDYKEWPAEKLRAVLAHEEAHVRNLDFYLQLLAGIYTAVFWISPLGWWLRRRLSVLGEAISDQAGLTEAPTRSDYAEIVLHFAAMPRRPMTGVAMACTGNVSRRIETLLNDEAYRSAFAGGRKRAWFAWLLLPCAVLAAGVLVRVPSAQAAQVTPAPSTPATNTTLAAPIAPAAAPQAPAAAPVPPPSPTSSSTTRTVAVHQSSTSNEDDSEGHGYSYSFSDHGDSYAVVSGSSKNLTMSGDWNKGDATAEIDKARRMTNGDFLWFRHEGKSYIVTDASTVAQIQAMYKPMEELGREQEELGKQQEKLGEEQERLGRLQEQASVPAPDVSREIAEINAAAAKLQAQKGKELTQDELAELQDKLGELQSRLGELQGSIGAKQGSLGEQQGRLGAQQGKLGEQQGRLGEQQGKLAREADRKVHSIIQDSLKNGQAKPVQ